MPKSRAAKIAANTRYNEKNVVHVKFGFNKKTDADIIEHLQKQANKQKYIKDLIRSDIEGPAVISKFLFYIPQQSFYYIYRQ